MPATPTYRRCIAQVLHIVATVLKAPPGHKWKLARQAFQNLRTTPNWHITVYDYLHTELYGSDSLMLHYINLTELMVYNTRCVSRWVLSQFSSRMDGWPIGVDSDCLAALMEPVGHYCQW